MKSLVVLFLVMSTAFAGGKEALTIDEISEVFERVFKEDRNVGLERSDLDVVLDQENIASELELSLEDDDAYCEYVTETDMKTNFKRIEKALSSRGGYIMRKYRNFGHIAHITSRYLVLEGSDDCISEQIRVVLNDGSLIWIDVNN